MILPVSPDPGPARRLGVELQRRRREGQPFDVAWEPAVGVAVSSLSKSVAQDWRDAFASTRKVWKANFERTATEARLFVHYPEPRDLGVLNLP